MAEPLLAGAALLPFNAAWQSAQNADANFHCPDSMGTRIEDT